MVVKKGQADGLPLENQLRFIVSRSQSVIERETMNQKRER
jgi:hypothetical protein